MLNESLRAKPAQIVLVGINHTTAPVAVRERLAIAPTAVPHVLARLGSTIGNGFVLSTCNRVEVYAIAGHAESGASILARFLADNSSVAVESVLPHVYTHAHDAAVRHLFRVAAGLDSMILGEDQILSQVKAALDEARAMDTIGPILHRLGSAALAVSKRVRTRTGIGRSPVSVVSVATRAARREFGDLRDKEALIVGAGRVAELTLRHLSRAGVTRITIVNRSLERARELAARYGAVARPWAELRDAISAADIMAACTNSPSVVVQLEDLGAGRSGGRRLLCIDLGVPRDLDPRIVDLRGIAVYDMDRLQAMAAENRGQRESALQAAEEIVAEGVETFMEWWRSRQVAPAIAQLRAHAEAIRDTEVQRALARIPELSPRNEVIIRNMASRIIGKLLHLPMTTLKSDPEGANMAQVVQQLFGLEDAGGHCPAGPMTEQESLSIGPAGTTHQT
ncbi:MAG: glutamyl-tRNA reductase [Gemmatimonadaceae bacterium]